MISGRKRTEEINNSPVGDSNYLLFIMTVSRKHDGTYNTLNAEVDMLHYSRSHQGRTGICVYGEHRITQSGWVKIRNTLDEGFNSWLNA